MKFTRAQCLPAVEFFLNALRPNCELLEVVGSYRRERPMVGDLEFAFVPKIIQEADGLFDTKRVSLPDKLIGNWLATGIITKRMTNAAAPPRIVGWGPLNKMGRHIESGIGVDFFCEPDIRDWPRTLAIRTGPRDWNVRLMATAPYQGFLAHAYGPSLFINSGPRAGDRVFPRTERDFIEYCGLPWAEPKDRR